MTLVSGAITAEVTPSPFGGAGPVTAEVTVRDGQLVVSNDGGTATIRPTRAVMGHGTLLVTATDPARRLLFKFAPYDVPKVARAQAALLGQLNRRLDQAGFRELLVALRDSGVPLRTSPEVRRGAGLYRASAWVGAFALLFVELGLFGLPAGVISAIGVGGLTTASPVADAVLMAGFIGFLLIAIGTSPIPLLVRRSFQQGATRDPIRYLDTWAGRAPESAGVGPGQRLGFVPGVPVLPAVILAAACGFYVFRVHSTMFAEVTPPATSDSGQPVVPEPAWLDGGTLSLVGYAGMVLLLVVFGTSVLRWRREPELSGVRWAPLIGAFFCLVFALATGEMRLTAIEEWLYLALIVMVVAFSCVRLAVGFGIFGALAVFVLLAAFGFFEDWRTALLLLPALVLIAGIAIRYLPGGARLVALPDAQAVRLQRIVWVLWVVAAGLGIGLAVTSANLLLVA